MRRNVSSRRQFFGSATKALTTAAMIPATGSLAAGSGSEDEVRGLIRQMEDARQRWRDATDRVAEMCSACTSLDSARAAERAADEACSATLQAEKALVSWLNVRGLDVIAVDDVLYVSGSFGNDPEADEEACYFMRIRSIPLARVDGVQAAPLKARLARAQPSC